MTTYPGAAPESVENDITKPLESSLSLVSGLQNISSVSAENVSMVLLEFNQEINIDSVMVELSSLVYTAAATFPDNVATPTILRINPSMLPLSLIHISLSTPMIFLQKFSRLLIIKFCH